MRARIRALESRLVVLTAEHVELERRFLLSLATEQYTLRSAQHLRNELDQIEEMREVDVTRRQAGDTAAA